MTLTLNLLTWKWLLTHGPLFMDCISATYEYNPWNRHQTTGWIWHATFSYNNIDMELIHMQWIFVSISSERFGLTTVQIFQCQKLWYELQNQTNTFPGEISHDFQLTAVLISRAVMSEVQIQSDTDVWERLWLPVSGFTETFIYSVSFCCILFKVIKSDLHWNYTLTLKYANIRTSFANV